MFDGEFVQTAFWCVMNQRIVRASSTIFRHVNVLKALNNDVKTRRLIFFFFFFDTLR